MASVSCALNFYFSNANPPPSEDEQLMIYQQIADLWPERTFVIRTLDWGGDKPLRYLPLPPRRESVSRHSRNSHWLKHEEILRTQLRAILRVKTSSKIHVMFP